MPELGPGDLRLDEQADEQADHLVDGYGWIASAARRATRPSRIAPMSATLFAISLFAAPLSPAPQFDPESELRPALERFQTDRRAVQRLHSLEGTPARRARLGELYESWSAHLSTYDFDALSRDAQVDLVLFGDLLEYERRGLELERARWDEMAELLPFAERIFAIEAHRRAMAPVDPEAAAEELEALRAAIEEAQERWRQAGEEQAPRRAVARRAQDTCSRLRFTLDGWHRFHAEYHPLYTWWCEAPYEAASQALGDYGRFLGSQFVDGGEEDPIVGDPIGAEALAAELARERIAYSPAELVAMAEEELDWCEARLLEATRALGFGEDWRAAMEHVKGMHVAPGEQPQLVLELAEEATAFLEERDLLTIPELAKEVWRMNMMSPERQRYTPYFTGGEVVSVSFPTAGMSHEQKLMSLRSNNIPFSRATVHHELIPGHHLQGYMAERHRTWRRQFRTAFLVEGWALYWEFRLWDLDFARDAADEVGMLFWRMHRCARVILSLGFHLGEREPDAMIDFLVERIGHEPSAAEAEVRRWVQGGYGPLYQCAYLIGGMQLEALHEELVESGRMSERAFHDAVLRQNSIPVEAIRAALNPEASWAPGAPPSWRF